MKLVIRCAIVLMLSVLAVPAALACGGHEQASNTTAATAEEPAAVEETPAATTEATPTDADSHPGCACQHGQQAATEGDEAAEGDEATATDATLTGGAVTCPHAQPAPEQAATEPVPGS